MKQLPLILFLSIVAFSGRAGTANVTSVPVGVATNAINATNIFFPVINPGTYSFGNASLWYWWASTGNPSECMKLYLSSDGETWYPATTNICDYKEPDFHTNNSMGPYSMEFTVQWDPVNQMLYGVYNYDPYNDGTNSQALGIAQSTDGTNWARIALIYPNGKTNGLGNTFAATWFTDTDGSNYLVYPYSSETGAGQGGFHLFIIRRLDDTYQNWSEPSLIYSNNEGAFQWDAQMINHNGRYELYYHGGPNGVATNDRPDTHFNFWKATDTTPGGDFSGEVPYLVQFSDQYWRLYQRTSGTGLLDGPSCYQETYDGGNTWSITPHFMPNNPNYQSIFHPPGMMAPPIPMLNLLSARNDILYAQYFGRYHYPTNHGPRVGNMLVSMDGKTETQWVSTTNHFANLMVGTIHGNIWNSGSIVTNYSGNSEGSPGWFAIDYVKGYVTNLVAGPVEMNFTARLHPATSDLFNITIENANSAPMAQFGTSGSPAPYPGGYYSVHVHCIRNLAANEPIRVTVYSDNDDSPGSTLDLAEFTVRSLFQ
jgi:hypothetical protein